MRCRGWARGVDAHVIHPSIVAISREHRWAKTDRLDTELLKRGFLGGYVGNGATAPWSRIPTTAEEDAKRPNRDRECLVKERTRLANPNGGHPGPAGHLQFQPTLRARRRIVLQQYTPRRACRCRQMYWELQRDMARLGFVLNQIREIEEARHKRLAQEPESGAKCREQGLARGGNARVHALWVDLLKLRLARSFRREVKRANDNLDLLVVFGWLAFEEP
jgi:transposase